MTLQVLAGVEGILYANTVEQQLHLIFLNFSARHQIISYQTVSQFLVMETLSC